MLEVPGRKTVIFQYGVAGGVKLPEEAMEAFGMKRGDLVRWFTLTTHLGNYLCLRLEPTSESESKE